MMIVMTTPGGADDPASPEPRALQPAAAPIVVLWRRERRAMLRLATVMLGRVDEAEEAVQDAFARVGPRLDRLRPEDHGRYLRTAVVNACRERHRRANTTKRRATATRDTVPTVEELALVGSERRRLAAALDALPARQRECLVLRYYAELTDTEIASTLGISPGSAKTHLRRALEALRTTIGASDD